MLARRSAVVPLTAGWPRRAGHPGQGLSACPLVAVRSALGATVVWRAARPADSYRAQRFVETDIMTSPASDLPFDPRVLRRCPSNAHGHDRHARAVADGPVEGPDDRGARGPTFEEVLGAMGVATVEDLRSFLRLVALHAAIAAIGWASADPVRAESAAQALLARDRRPEPGVDLSPRGLRCALTGK